VRIVVFGAGAMGSFFGGLLSMRHEVTLVGRRAHVQALRAHGLRITGKTSLIAHPEAATRLSRGIRADLVIVSTKAYDTSGAMAQLRPLAKSAIFLTLQNGLDNPEIIAQTASRVVAGTTSHGVTFLGPGAIRHAGVGDTVLGPWSGVAPHDVTRLRDVLADAGIRTRVTEDVRSELWAKAVVNGAINPIAALANVPNGVLVKDRGLLALLEGTSREAAAAAHADGARVDGDDLRRRAILVARRTAGNRSSMLQDLDHHRRTEIDAITGAILRAADRHGLDVPLNRALYALVRARETVFLDPSES
jgi:2-dehydropantoate 2-reductase